MWIDVALNPAEIALLPGRALAGTTCVVFDVLRATSSMVTALAHGATAIHPVSTIEEALALHQKLPGAVLAGERHGERIDGFALGNSPFEYREEVRGRTLVTTTTNGTVALRSCAHAGRVLVGALLNLGALGAEIRRHAPERLLLVCAGTFEEFALEDAFAAALLLQGFEGAELSDAARALLALPGAYDSPLNALRSARNGRVLESKGRGAEVEWCAQCSLYPVVGEMQEGCVAALAP